MNVKRVVIVLAVVSVLLAAGCSGLPGPGSESTSARDAARANVKWDNDSAGYLTVQNDIDEDLILFAGSVNNRNILGGVRKLSERRVDFSGRLNENSGTFLLRAVKESVYRSTGSNLSSDDVVFAGLVVFDTANPRAIVVNIRKLLGGDAQVIIQNDTNMALQIRVDRPDGPTLTTLAPFERNKRVYMDYSPDGYTFFPVYQYYDRATQGIRSVMAQDLYDGRFMGPQIPGRNVQIPVINFNSSPTNLVSPFATLIVSNESTQRAAYLLQGAGRMTNQNGSTFINPGTETYELNLQGQSSYEISGLRIDFNVGERDILRVPDFTFEAGIVYRLRVREGVAPTITQVGKSDTSDLALTLLNE